ncbi:MAG: hypothetical protein AAGD25_31255 [Cyanobacteria bacterium P01_F01_bin.150]
MAWPPTKAIDIGLLLLSINNASCGYFKRSDRSLLLDERRSLRQIRYIQPA